MFSSLKKLAMKFEPAQIIRKSSQVGGQTRHKSIKVKTCDDLSGLKRMISVDYKVRLPFFYIPCINRVGEVFYSP